ncbi:MAG: hypothetical protein KGH72_00285 [Candidatus Micrarchaeota archaeon]|nr:hypothetical protein [Candidatus Micrarchaeota archaeon]
MPNKNLPVKVTIFDLYPWSSRFEKTGEFSGMTAMFEYVGDSLDYIALYDKELFKGFALSNINENSTDIQLVYVRDTDDDTVKQEETLLDIFDAKARAFAKDALKQTTIPNDDICLIYVDGYEDYEEMPVTKLLPLRKHFRL